MYNLHANLGILASAAKLSSALHFDKSPIMYSQVCCPKPLTICLPGHSCGAKLKCESRRSKKKRIIKDCNECIQTCMALILISCSKLGQILKTPLSEAVDQGNSAKHSRILTFVKNMSNSTHTQIPQISQLLFSLLSSWRCCHRAAAPAAWYLLLILNSATE